MGVTDWSQRLAGAINQPIRLIVTNHSLSLMWTTYASEYSLSYRFDTLILWEQINKMFLLNVCFFVVSFFTNYNGFHHSKPMPYSLDTLNDKYLIPAILSFGHHFMLTKFIILT